MGVIIMEEVFIGIDISKKSFDVSVYSSVQVTYKKKYNMTKGDFSSFFSYLQGFTGKIYVFMEPTGEYYVNLANFLTCNGYAVYLVNQFKLKNYIAANSLRKQKNDKKDSAWIARFGKDSMENLRKYNSSDNSILPQLMRAREFLIKDITTYKNRIRAKLNISFPELEENYDVFGVYISEIVSQYPSAYSISRVDIEELKSRYTTKFKLKFLDEIYLLSKESCSTVEDVCDVSISSYYRILFQLLEELEVIENKIKEVSTQMEIFSENIKILESIEGVGFESALKLIAFSNIYNKYVNEVFSNYRKWLAFSGTDPTSFLSGTSVQGGSRISKRGSRNLRALAFTLGLSLIKNNTKFREYYLQKKKENGKGKKYVFAVWHKFLRVAYHLLSTRQYYKA